MDGLTAALLTPRLHRQGWSLSDFACSLRTAVSGSYERIHFRQLKRDAMAAGFVIGTGGDPTVLLVPGADAFSAAGDSLPMRGVPAMWGSVLRIDDRLELRPDAIRCHPNVIALPSRNTGRILLVGQDLPETLLDGMGGAMAGRPLTGIVSVQGFDLPAFPVKSVRRARAEDLDRARVDTQTLQAPMGATLAPAGLVIAVSAGSPMSVEID